MKLSKLISSVFLAFFCAALSSPALAQKLNPKYRAFPNIGVEYKTLKEFSDVPINNDRVGLVGKFKVEQSVFVKTNEGKRIPMKDIGCDIIYVENTGPTTGGKKGVTVEKDKRNSAQDFLESVSGSPWGARELVPEDSTVKLSKEFEAHRTVFATALDVTYDSMDAYIVEYIYEIYTISIASGKLVFIWEYPGDTKLRKKWESAVKKSMRTFRYSKGGAVTTDIDDVNSESSYEDLLEFHQNEVAQTPGWRLIETPKKQYLIKTNSDDDKDIKEVIQRLEASRELYEKDFPPPQPITSISVVRVCGSEEVFHTYGDTGRGVGGWFNPGSEELVLYFGEDGKSSTLSVMAHEGFHQYCHFLFDRAAAHRWFDEGHGDYYGAWSMKGKKLIQEEDMKGGFARLPELKRMIRDAQIAPLSDHIRFNHPEWQGQGPSNVSCYAQSFGLISYLRMGARGKVKSKYWDKQYNNILPDYMAALHKGFQDTYAEIRAEAQKQLDSQLSLPIDDQDPDTIDRAEKQLESPWDYARSKAPDIREAAMDASWGKIDEKEFEAKWLAWIDVQF